MQSSRLLASVLLAVLASPLAADGAAARLSDPTLPALARQLAPGAVLRLEAVPLGAGHGDAALTLERFTVFAPDARVVVRGAGGTTALPAPDNAYFRGRIDGDPASRAMLTVRAAGGVRGLIASAGRYWIVAPENETDGAPIAVREIDVESELAAETGSFRCASDDLGGTRAVLDQVFQPAPVETLRAAPAKSGGGPGEGTTHGARVAVDTDFELYQLFGNVADATDYIGDVLAYSSTIYSAEVDTALIVGEIFLHTTAGDPWLQFGTTCGLMEFGRYWNQNHDAVERTIAHFFSGKNNGGGVAWVGVLCSDAFSVTLSDFGLSCAGLPNTDSYGGAYGYSGDLDGNFNIGNPGVVWDIVVVSHEIGHNFNSPHSHCYGGLGGNPSPVDTCNGGQCGGAGCHCGATSLPCGTPGGGCGTIMSYCHLLSGGLGNISLTFGDGHPFGVAPERIPARMSDHVVATAAIDPACLAPGEPPAVPFFADGFEAGDVNAWQLTTLP